MPIDFYWIKGSPPCKAVLMTARHLNIDLNFKPIDISKGEHLKPDFLKLNPAHCLPTIVDNGFVLGESRAIMAYLCNQYAPDSTLYPKEPKKRAQVDAWLDWDITLSKSIKEGLIIKEMFGVIPTEDQSMAMKNNIKLLDEMIGDNKYLVANQLTIADLSVLMSATLLDNFQFEGLADCPNLKRWMATLKRELPQYKEVHVSPEETKANIEEFVANLQKEK